MSDDQKLIDEYSESYCSFLEAAYGEGMMSEGGADAIDKMFQGKNISGKKLLDVGCGLGGVIFYLAQHHNASFIGLELNPWMIEEATRRIPPKLKNRVSFSGYTRVPNTAFKKEQFDIVFSKGVLTHVNNKKPLFNELHRILKSGGEIIIDDWLSPHEGKWGPRVQKMCDIEDLTLYAETETNYKQLLSEAGFSDIQMIDRNPDYACYNQHIVSTLKTPDCKKKFSEQFDKPALEAAIDCYQMIADAIRENELLIRAFEAKKA